jgi:uncharacterized protein YozE (UPF0346 family)
MHFYEFITTQLQQGQDPTVQQVIDIIKKDANFPTHTSDPAQLAIYLYLKLNEAQTTKYQQLLMLYKQLVPKHKFPKRTTAREDMFMDAINLIVSLQNNDSRYPH